jgi:FG-GAP repeat
MRNTPNNMSRLCLSLLAAGICPNALAAGELQFSLAATASHMELGSEFAVLGDLTGDGVVDIAVADRSAIVASSYGSGIVHLVNGVDGSLIRSYEGTPAASQGFGSSLVALNANGDGIPDLAVGSPGQADTTGPSAGAVRIYSGFDGSLLKIIAGPSASLFGASLVNAGDQDGDGLDDLYVGAPNGNGRKGTAFAVSSGGAVLRTISTTFSLSALGTTLAVLGDIDNDGLADVAVGAPGYRVSGNQAGRVIIVRSSDGTTAAEMIGSGAWNRLGDSLAPATDANGDDKPDLLVGSYSGGTARLLSGTDLSILADLSIPTLPAYRPLVVGGSLDFDSDGTADWLIGSPELQDVGGTRVGGIRVVSGNDQSALFEFTATVSGTGLGQTLKILPGLGMAAGEVNLLDPVTGGKGLARVWKVEEIQPVLDTDGDGVYDDVDAVPASIMDVTVILGGIDSRVPNRIDADGTTLADLFAELGVLSDCRKPAHYLVAVTHLTTKLVKSKDITRKEALKLTAAALKASLKAAVKSKKR